MLTSVPVVCLRLVVTHPAVKTAHKASGEIVATFPAR
jgi:hypothetical protein